MRAAIGEHDAVVGVLDGRLGLGCGRDRGGSCRGCCAAPWLPLRPDARLPARRVLLRLGLGCLGLGWLGFGFGFWKY